MSLYPRFGDAEMARRHDALAAAMAERDVAHLVVYGANRTGSAVGWLTRWPVTREALVVVTPDEPDLLLVNFYNHVPNAERIATEAEVRWAGERPMATAVEELRRRGTAGGRVGLIGPLGWRPYGALAELAGELVPMDDAYTRLRLVKSEEELAWVQVACELTDAGAGSLAAGAAPGMDERELGNLVERGYVGRGGTTHIHYFGATSMDEPETCVPAQWPTARPLAAGDALTFELSASWWEYTGQLLRTVAVGAEPSPLYRELHDVADAAFEALFSRLRPGATAADLADAGRLIEDAGFTIRDDLVHGFVGGYFPPVIGARAPVPEFTFEAGMTVVIQPNVVTRDETAGVQTGELVVVTDDGAERLHTYPLGRLSIDA